MDASQAYILISILILLVIAILFFIVRKNRRQQRLTPLAGIAFGFVVAGIVFGGSRIIGYSLIGIGVLLSIIDMVRKLK